MRPADLTKFEKHPNSTLFEVMREDCKTTITCKDGHLYFHENGQLTMSGGYWECPLVKYASLRGVDNDILVGGLGFGNTSETAVKHGNVTTIELLPELVEFYRSIVSHIPFEIVVSNMRDYVSQVDRKFDAVIFDIDIVGLSAGGVVHLSSNKKTVAKEYISHFKRVLKPNGVFLIKGVESKGLTPELYCLLWQAGFTIKRLDIRPLESNLAKNRMTYQCFNRGEHHAQR